MSRGVSSVLFLAAVIPAVLAATAIAAPARDASDLSFLTPKAAALYTPKPDMEHMFRPAAKRPSTTVSTVFSGLVLAPVAVLLILV
eukprot:EC721483.1.p1 GENE.EC721483.1~~EC721483.1.p1  ORF type:complete len:86 (+),score=17.61 EC721483.1:46-303(+)